MARDEFTSYEGTTGLLDDEDVVIADVEFGHFEMGQNEVFCAKVTFETEEDGDESEQLFSCGKGWEGADKGTRAVLERTGEPNPKGFNKSTQWMQFVLSIVEHAGVDFMVERGKAYERDTFVGLRLHVGQIEEKVTFGDKKGEMVDRLRCTGFNGVKGDDKKPAAKSTSSKPAASTGKIARPAKTEEAEETEAEGGDAIEMPAKLRGQLKKLAKEASDHDDFMERVYSEIDGADAYDTIIEDASEDGFYAQNAE